MSNAKEDEYRTGHRLVCMCVFAFFSFFIFPKAKGVDDGDGHCHAVADLIVEKRLRWQQLPAEREEESLIVFNCTRLSLIKELFSLEEAAAVSFTPFQ